ncbi:hypothetical protein F5X68DRAFT_262691 [Plectosphaerella plurivora]|uniref:Copper acquisition factor BIM1-like domain-containing protein n=1 Tax=Plectosphaerella plurivora TaxID=936078 RepID=A0A9P8V937_9PEZI|nr:hypothetical protein F5X68DRAFT_262691 [Plectosphaerella plurivora]
MLSKSILALTAAVGLSSAHYTVVYPEWRGDSLDAETNYTQWDRPCAGVAYGAGNRTDWPLEGGSLKVALGHDFNYAFVNLGLEENGTVANFNISLTPQPLNTTGHGTLCLRHLPVSLNLTDDTNASIQVVMVGPSGNAMYNCADIRLTSSAEVLSEDDCTNEDADSYVIEDQEGFNATSTGGHGDDHGSGTETEDAAASTSAPPSAAGITAASMSTVFGLGLAAAVAMAL